MPSSNQVVGDVYNVEDTGDNYAWTGTAWDKLAGTVDLSGYLTIANASTTYLTQTSASSTYATKTQLNQKADATDLSAYATLASPALTGTATLNGQNIATTNQIPDVSDFITAADDIDGNAATATRLATARTIALSGDATGSASFNGSANATIATTLANSGVAAGSYGPTANATPAAGATFSVPQVTVDAKGRVTSAVTRTVKIPAAPTSVSGNAGTATKLATARTISLTGDATGSTTFDGSANRSITVSVSHADAADSATTATSATQLATARTIRTNLASTSTASFNGTGNVTPGVTGTLPLTNGGTGATSASAALGNLGGVAVSGARGNLAGYETPLVQSGAITINSASRDSIKITGAVTITVSNGSSGQSWVKKIAITSASASVSLGSFWHWVGGSAPEMSANSLLVLSWDDTFGTAILQTAG